MTESTLAALAAEINGECTAADKAAHISDTTRAGELQDKEECPHSTWLAWLAINIILLTRYR